ncbi:hypothetical protein D3C78_1367160 [compost metagenome]
MATGSGQLVEQAIEQHQHQFVGRGRGGLGLQVDGAIAVVAVRHVVAAHANIPLVWDMESIICIMLVYCFR